MARPKKPETERADVIVGVPLPRKVVRELDQLAQEERRSRAMMTRVLIEEGLEEHKQRVLADAK